MEKKLFSRGLYVEGLRQLKLVGIIILAILLLIGIAVPVLQYVNYLDYMSSRIEEGVTYTPQVYDFLEMCPMVVGIAIVAAPIFTFIMFGAFNKRSSSDFYHSLPYTRICMFLSFTAAVFTWLIGLTVVYCGVTIATFALMPQVFIVNLAGMGDILLSMLAIAMMLVFGIIAAMSLTGTPIANITCTGLILFLPRLLITLVTLVLGDIAPIISGHYGIFGTEYNVIVGLLYNVFVYGDDAIFANNIPADIYSICLGIIYAVLAAILFCKRKSETSGHAAPDKAMQHIIRICVGLVISSIVTCAMISGLEISVCIVFYIVAIIVYFAYELITQKTFRTIPSTLPGLAILLGLNIAIIGVCFGTAAVVHSYTPEDNEVAAIYLEDYADRHYGYGSEMDFNLYASRKASEIKIEDRDAIAIAAENLRENAKRSAEGKFYPYSGWDDYGKVEYTELPITYVTKSGAKKTRNIYIPFEEYTEMMDHIQSNDDYKSVFYDIPEALRRSITIMELTDYNQLNLTDDDALEILESIRNEAKAMDFSAWTTYLVSASGKYNCAFELKYQPVSEEHRIRILFDSEHFPKTTALLIEKANKNADEFIERFYDVLSDYAKAEDEYEYLNMSITAVEDNITWQLYHYYSSDYDSSYATEEFVSDLKALGEEMKESKHTEGKYVAVNFNYGKDENEDGYYHTKYYTFFLPYPEDFKPQSDNFEFYSYDEYYDEEYEKYKEDVEIMY